MYSDAYQSQPHRALNLLYAITLGQATIGDVVAELRKQGVDYSTLQFRKKTSQELVSRIVQRVPEVPFILNGKIYDPKDITRFNGQELHFVPAPNGSHMLGVDNQELFESWLGLAYLEISGYGTRGFTTTPSGTLNQGIIDYIKKQQGGVQTQMGGYQPYQPQSASGRQIVLPPPFGEIPLSPPPPKTHFYEHINTQGSRLDLDANRGYRDLTKVSMGLFGDWNDKISSVLLRGTKVAVLHEHINWTGQKLTLFNDEKNLHRLGWGDRASSIETW